MKKLLIVATLVTMSSTFAVEVLPGDTIPQGCEKIAVIRAGNVSNTYPKNTAEQIIKDEAAKLNAQKVSLVLVEHQHQKLGKKYSAKGIAWKCGK